MELIKYIQEHENWEQELTAPPYNLHITQKEYYGEHFYCFKYDQLASDFSIPLVQEARGIIIDDYGYGFIVACRPFTKFFNYQEPNAYSIDWSKKVSITEKVDGSLIKVWYNYSTDKWQISTNSTIDAYEAEISDPASPYANFAELFIAAVEKYLPFADFLEQLPDYYTHMFELVSPYNQVVVPYDLDVYYITSKENSNGRECKFFFPMKDVRSYEFSSMEELARHVQKLPWTKEGFVVYDGTGRVKVKSDAYIKAHYLANNGQHSVRSLVKIWLDNETNEFLGYFPRYKPVFDTLTDLRAMIVYGIAPSIRDGGPAEASAAEYADWVHSNVNKAYWDYAFRTHRAFCTWEAYEQHQGNDWVINFYTDRYNEYKDSHKLESTDKTTT